MLRNTQTYVIHLLNIFRLLRPGTAATPKGNANSYGSQLVLQPLLWSFAEIRIGGRAVFYEVSLSLFHRRERQRENILGNIYILPVPVDLDVYIDGCIHSIKHEALS